MKMLKVCSQEAEIQAKKHRKTHENEGKKLRKKVAAEFLVLESDNLQDLTKQINEKLSEGFIMLDAPAATNPSDFFGCQWLCPLGRHIRFIKEKK